MSTSSDENADSMLTHGEMYCLLNVLLGGGGGLTLDMHVSGACFGG